jgi:hypothetical protein
MDEPLWTTWSDIEKKTKLHLSLENENIPKNDDESYKIDQCGKKTRLGSQLS